MLQKILLMFTDDIKFYLKISEARSKIIRELQLSAIFCTHKLIVLFYWTLYILLRLIIERTLRLRVIFKVTEGQAPAEGAFSRLSPPSSCHWARRNNGPDPH